MKGITIRRRVEVSMDRDAVAQAVADAMSDAIGFPVDPGHIGFSPEGEASFEGEEPEQPVFVGVDLAGGRDLTAHWLVDDELISDQEIAEANRAPHPWAHPPKAGGCTILANDEGVVELPEDITVRQAIEEMTLNYGGDPVAAACADDDPDFDDLPNDETQPLAEGQTEPAPEDLTADQIEVEPVVTRKATPPLDKPKPAAAPADKSEADEPDPVSGWTLREDAALAKFSLQGMNEGGISRQHPLTRRRTSEIRRRLADLIAEYGDIKEAAKSLNRLVDDFDASAKVSA